VTSVAHPGDWTGVDVEVADVERRLVALRGDPDPTGDGVPDLRTSVMTHIAWIPPAWEAAAIDTLAGLAERHPSRTILLVPDETASDGMDAEVAARCYAVPGQEHHVCSEVIQLRLRGRSAAAPASVVEPLLVPDLPVFLRWRGRPDFGATQFVSMTGVVDRLIVDSREWPDVPRAYAELLRSFDRIAVSDIAWARTLGWRRRIADVWPAPASARRIRCEAPPAESHLLAGWLRARLRTQIALEHGPSDEIRAVALDGQPVAPPRGRRPTASDLLSAELDRFARDRVYEEAVTATLEPDGRRAAA
jgi:glucose-6-phosphate dehydrogenase assembly protein OpcA